MKKVWLGIFVLSLIVLSSCNVISQYLPENNNDNESPTGFVVIDNPFVFVNESSNNQSSTDDTEVIVISDDEDEAPQDDEEVKEEEPVEEDSSSEVSSEEPAVFATVTATEGEIVSLSDLLAEDPDGDSISYSYSEPFNENGLWQTNDGDEGKYLVTIIATDGILSTSEQLQIVVLPSNKGPVIDCDDEFTYAEGDLIDLPCTIFDKEGDEVTYSVSGFMEELSYQTTFDDAGSHIVIISATDGNKRTAKEISLEITNTNRAPTAQPVELLTASEGDEVIIEIVASDADGDDLSIEYPLLFDEDGTWETEKGDAGTYELEAVVSDGEDELIVPINLYVEKVNSPPQLAEIEDIEVNEGETISLDIDVQDEDGDDVEVTITGFMTSETYETTFDDAGSYEVTVEASDGKLTVSQTIAITVNDVNRPPVFILK